MKTNEELKAGCFIVFDLDCWDENGTHFIKEFKARVNAIQNNPFMPPHCSVQVNGEDYGIRLSDVKYHFEPDGTQLELF